jgi:hypothetical protein
MDGVAVNLTERGLTERGAGRGLPGEAVEEAGWER